MKRPTILIQAVLDQLALDLDLSVERDKQRIAYRCEHEGLSFLTITLPLLSDALERGLETGTFTCPNNYSRHGSLPRFLGGFFKRVFDKDGRLLSQPCPETIAGIRQICRFFKKLKIGCTPKREAKAEAQFVTVEGELRRETSQIMRRDKTLDEISRILWAQVFPELDYLDLVCHHGPGSTASRDLANARFRVRRWNQRSEHSYPSDLHCYPNYGAAAEYAGAAVGEGGVDYLDLKDEEPVRVVFVPKTQTAPRVIAIEPSHMQYMQQSLKDHMYSVLESHPLTKRSIRFADQSFNQRLAYRSSKDKRLATLDLKDASDRVHFELVNRVFRSSGILEYLQDARSLHATLPSGKNLVLWKYASMGSALCFPVEACVFYTLIQSAMHQLDGKCPSSQSIREYSKRIAIYGDDLIFPVEYTDTIVRYLESYALRVNRHKSFVSSHFRESCGADFYNGTDVKPVYARELPYDNARDWTPSTLMSWAATSDLFYLKGQWIVAQAIRDMVSQVARRHIPRSRFPGAGLYFLSLLFTTDLRYNRNLQCWKQKRVIFTPVKTKDEIDGDDLACLNKWGILNDLRSRKESVRLRRALGLPAGRDSDRWASRLIRDGSSTSVHRAVQYGILPLTWQQPDRTEESLDDLAGVSTSSRDQSMAQLVSQFSDALYRAKLSISPDHAGRGGLDFLTSVKRGSFKSQCRWVSLLG